MKLPNVLIKQPQSTGILGIFNLGSDYSIQRIISFCENREKAIVLAVFY